MFVALLLGWTLMGMFKMTDASELCKSFCGGGEFRKTV